jgi:hypothetical protein
VDFNNSPGAIGGSGAPLFDVDGTTRLAGTSYLAQLYAGPDAGSLLPWGDPLSFRTGAGAGFFNTTGVNTARTIGTVASGNRATIAVRAWEAAGGATYETAVAAGFKFGSSTLFTVATSGGGEPPTLPSKLVGLTSFSLIPEPSTYALLGLGATALSFRMARRR